MERPDQPAASGAPDQSPWRAAAVIEGGLLAVLAFGACAFGGVQPGAYSLMEVGVLLLLLSSLWSRVHFQPGLLRVLAWPAVFSLYVVGSVLPLPGGILGKISPEKFSIASSATVGEGARWPFAGALSVYPHMTKLAILKLLMYVGGFFLAYLVFDYRGRKRPALVTGLLALGVFEAGYGLVQYLTGFQKIFGFTKIYYIEDATGTYINRNHFAGLLEMLAPLTLGILLGELGRRRRGPREASARAAGEGRAYPVPILGFALVLMTLGGLYSRSRMGLAVTLVSLLFVAGMASVSARRARILLVTVGLLAVVGLYGAWIGFHPVKERFEELSEAGGGDLGFRVQAWRETLGLVRDYPVFGTGLGTFELVYRRYQASRLAYRLDHAHNDYLEFLVETGAVGAVLLFAPIFCLWYFTARAGVRSPDPQLTYLAFGVSGSILALLLHSLVDFNLQIPANALLFSMLLGMARKLVALGAAPHPSR